MYKEKWEHKIREEQTIEQSRTVKSDRTDENLPETRGGINNVRNRKKQMNWLNS